MLFNLEYEQLLVQGKKIEWLLDIDIEKKHNKGRREERERKKGEEQEEGEKTMEKSIRKNDLYSGRKRNILLEY